MASILVKTIVLKFRQMTYRPSDDYVEVDSIHPRYKVDKVTKTRTDILEGWNLDFVSTKGQIQTVKLPEDASIKAILDKIQIALDENKVVKVKFGNPSTFIGKIYEILEDGRIKSGVSATATKLEIVAIESADDDSFDDDVID